MHPPPAHPPSPRFWFRGSSAVPVSGHGHQHLTLAHVLQGTRQAVEVPVVLLQSFPEVQDDTRGARFGGKVVQVPGGGKEEAIGLPKYPAPPGSLGNGESTGGGGKAPITLAPLLGGCVALVKPLLLSEPWPPHL